MKHSSTYAGSNPVLIANNAGSLTYSKHKIMATLSFTFGVLSVIAILLVIVLTVGAVKVYRQENELTQLNQTLLNLERNLYQDMHNQERSVNDQITDSVTQANSYTDKRIDKLIDTYFAVKEAEKESKKLLKG